MMFHYVTRLQGIRRRGGTVQLYANLPLPLAAGLDLEAGETVTWKVLDRTHLLLVRLPERKKLKGQAAPRRKQSRRREDRAFQRFQPRPIPAARGEFAEHGEYPKFQFWLCDQCRRPAHRAVCH